MAPRRPGKARLKKQWSSNVSEMANGENSPNQPNIIPTHLLEKIVILEENVMKKDKA